jgi:hypothetical protein
LSISDINVQGDAGIYAGASFSASAIAVRMGKSRANAGLLASKFDLGFEDDETIYYDRDGEAVWHTFVTGYGPTKALAASLDDRARDSLKRDFVAFHDAFVAPLGIRMPRQYLLTVGTLR